MRRFLVALLLTCSYACQPAGTARIVRTDNAIAVQRGRFAFANSGSYCVVPLVGDRLLFDRTVPADPVNVKITFTYEPPSRLPDDWPAGSWCDSLAQRVRSVAVKGVGENILTNPRAASDALVSALQRDLQSADLTTSGMSARFDLPPGWERTRPIPAIARLAHASRPVIFIGLDGADW